MIHLVNAESEGPAVVYVVCEEHLERALDELLEIYEMPPDALRTGSGEPN